MFARGVLSIEMDNGVPLDRSDPGRRLLGKPDPHDERTDLAAGGLLRVLEALDRGVLLVEAGGRVRFANALARQAMDQLGGTGSLIPAALARAIEEEAEAPPEGFSQTVKVEATRTAQYDMRWRSMPGGHRLVVLSPARASRAALIEQLRQQFGATLQEARIALLIREGLSNQEIADHLGLSQSTVKTYVSRLFVACNIRTRTRLIVLLDQISPRAA